tara:strand:- start:784 stop:1017 length:234 start_codon:yes stop_codon:yes gene_type:complete
MDGLAFFRLTQVPKRESKKRKVVSKVEVVPEESGVEYNCSYCGQKNIVTTTSNIQCTYCDWRILQKGRKSTVTINAV